MKLQRIHLFETLVRCFASATLVLSLLPAAEAATFRHPQLGYTVWYPDGWKVHSPPALVEPLEPPPYSFGAWELLGKGLLDKRANVDGLFVASTCGQAAYTGEGKILPEDHTELAVWREGGASCSEVVERVGKRMYYVTSSEGTFQVQGREVTFVYFYAHPYAQWPVLFMLACKEIGQSHFVLRLAFGGPGADLDRLKDSMRRVYESLQFSGGAK